MVDAEVGPRHWLSAMGTVFLLFRVPDQSTLFGGEDALCVLLFIQRYKKAAHDLASALAGGEAIGISLNGQEVFGVELIV